MHRSVKPQRTPTPVAASDPTSAPTAEQAAGGGSGPTPAQRARTVLEHASSAVLDVPGLDLTARPFPSPLPARTVLPDGTVLIRLADSSPVLRCVELAHRQSDNLRAVIEATDVAPVAVRHRIRGRAWVSGWLTPVPSADRERYRRLLTAGHPHWPGSPGELVLLEAEEVVIDDLWGSARVDPAAFARAQADPIAPHEPDLLQHLATAHADQLAVLTALVAERLAEVGPDEVGTGGAGAGRVSGVAESGVRAVPVALDRFGLRVRFLAGERVADARFDFARPVEHPEQLRAAMHQLFRHAEWRAGQVEPDQARR